MKIFLDSNVILDFLLDREPYNDDIAQIIEYALSSTLELCISSSSVTDLYFIISRLQSPKKARQKIKAIIKWVTVESVDSLTIEKAANSDFTDFEDAVQNFCALEADHQILVTRNVKDYRKSSLAIMTPKEFLAKILT